MLPATPHGPLRRHELVRGAAAALVPARPWPPPPPGPGQPPPEARGARPARVRSHGRQPAAQPATVHVLGGGASAPRVAAARVRGLEGAPLRLRGAPTPLGQRVEAPGRPQWSMVRRAARHTARHAARAGPSARQQRRRARAAVGSGRRHRAGRGDGARPARRPRRSDRSGSGLQPREPGEGHHQQTPSATRIDSTRRRGCWHVLAGVGGPWCVG